jgi:hypothetical protein
MNLVRKDLRRPTRRFGAVLVACALIAVSFGAVTTGCPGGASASDCASGCKARYGQCYKSSQNRAQCDAALQRCLQGCR